MEIEYKRELTKSYMCVKTDQDFLPFEKEILTRSSILGIVPVNTIFADAATVCWYDITGMQAFDHALEMEMMDSQMLTQFLVSLCGTLERLEGFLLDPGHLWFSQESIFKNNRDGSFWFCYCPEGKENITEGFQKLMEYLLTKIDHKDQRAVKMAYHIYDQVIKEGYSLIAIRESLTYDRVDIEPVPDRTLENSRVELEQTSDQTEKEKNVHKADKADGKAKVIFQKAIEHFFPDFAKIKEYRQELAKKKEKKKKEKAPKQPKEKKVKPKKEKKPKPPAEPDNTPPLPKVPVILVFVMAASILVLVLAGTHLLGYSNSFADADQAFAEGRYSDAFQAVAGEKVKEKDTDTYEKYRITAMVSAEYEAYESMMDAEVYDMALDSLIRTVQRYDKYLQDAETYGCRGEFDKIESAAETALQQDFGLTAEDARTMYALSNKETYSREIYKVLEKAGLSEVTE